MLPTSIAGSILIVRAADRVAGHDGAYVDASNGSRAPAGPRADGRRAVGAGHVGPGSTAASSRIGSSAPTGPMNPGGPSRSATSSGRGGPERRAERVAELDLVDPMVAADHHQLHLAVVEHDGKALSSAPAGTPVARRQPRRRPPGWVTSSGAPAGWERHRLGVGAGHLEVGGVSPAPARPRSRRPRRGAMYSSEPCPPIIPTSAFTRYHSRPQRSHIRS